MRILTVAVALLLLALPPASGQERPTAAGEVRFNRDIRPLLAESCFLCHGPDPGSRKGGLRFDREEGFFSARKGAVMVVRGKPEASPLYQRITSKDPEEVMPPPKSHKALKPHEKELIRRWIAQGAPWESHWSFLKPERPALPAVKASTWVRTPIDRFVLAKLEAKGLAPAPEADRRTLARRASLDLVGLPPEPAEVDAFVADPAPDAYEKLVDRLLASPRYGEHRARYWLDAARYADTHGLHFDNFRDIWPYRDWVIAAFNRNQPFDRFTVDQIAGDLLPEPTKDQIVATGFHRCAITTNEGGSIDAEVLAQYARERVETTSWVWLGLTANCAVCHDHKFDPITQKDFYSLSAFFRNTTQGAMDGNIRDTAPVMVMPKPEDEARWGAIPKESEGLQAAVAARKKALREEFDGWLASAKPEDWDAEVSAIGAPMFHLPLRSEEPGDALTASLNGAAVGAKFAGTPVWAADAPFGKGLVLDGKAPVEISGDVGDFEKDASFSFGGWLKTPKDFKADGALFARMDADDGYKGWDLLVQGGEFVVHLVSKWDGDAIKIVTTEKRVKADQWQHVFVTYNGSSKAEGLKVYVDGKESKTKAEKNQLKNSMRTKTPFVVGQRSKGSVAVNVAVQDLRIYGRKLAAGDVGRLAMSAKARKVIERPAEKRDAKEKDALFEVRASGDPELSAATEKLAALEAEKKTVRERSYVAYVMEERKGQAPTANILMRGEYDKPKDKVDANVFSALHPLAAEAPRNRLGLAQWLVSPDNALVPRVTVNRLWQELFGTGIVKTSEDFGIMGDAPSHPELLDWMAVEFRDGGWDVKKILRLMVTSAAYRQSAAATKEKHEKDSANRLLSRGPRFRMDAEMMRDQALAAAGLLSTSVGGPSVKPYQPEGVWDVVGMPGSNTRDYRRDSGEKLYRRSLYTFWKRAAPPPSMDILNAPSREFSCLRRERTNTPLQALVTLNDPQFVEAARALAQRALKEGGADDAARLDFVARRALSRPFSNQEKTIVRKVLEGLRERYRARPEDAKALVSVGESKPDAALDVVESAAWTMVCNQILNLDEVLNK